MTTTIELQVFSDGLGDEWNDIDAAGEAFAAFLESRIAAEYPDADVDVSYHANLAGCTSDHVYSDDGDEDTIQDRVNQLAERAWQDFCDSDAAATL